MAPSGERPSAPRNVAGIIAPLLFATVFTAEGWLRPGYDWRSMYVSELALGPRGFVQIANFIVFGLLQLLFARGMAGEFPDGDASRAGPIALRLIGVGMIASGLFVMDPLPTPIADLSWHGWLHALAGRAIFYAWPASCFIFQRRFRAEPTWRSLAPWTVAAGWTTAALLVIVTAVLLATRLDPGNPFAAWGGLLQRAYAIVALGWQLAVAIRLHRTARSRTVPSASESSGPSAMQRHGSPSATRLGRYRSSS